MIRPNRIPRSAREGPPEQAAAANAGHKGDRTAGTAALWPARLTTGVRLRESQLQSEATDDLGHQRRARPGRHPASTAGALTTVLLEGRATEGDIAVLEFVVGPRSFGAQPHVHHNEDEYFYVLEGEVHFLNEARVVTAPKGTFAAMTRGHLHAFWNASDAPARLLLAIAPGEVGAFFDQVVSELRASGAVDPAKIGETIARIGKQWNVDTHPELVPDEARPFLPH